MEQGWTCPVCDKYHSKHHYALPGQVDEKKDPDTPGRVKFNRVDKDGYEKDDTEWKKGMPETGPAVNKDGYPNGLFCSHCGWVQKVIVITKSK